jgi:hypothetical protein
MSFVVCPAEMFVGSAKSDARARALDEELEDELLGPSPIAFRSADATGPNALVTPEIILLNVDVVFETGCVEVGCAAAFAAVGSTIGMFAHGFPGGHDAMAP